MVHKPSTLDDYHQRINRVRLYIQDHLDQPLQLETLARLACLSPYHFHRMFAAFCGESLNAHIRRLRLERAALQLRHTQLSITDIAYAAGYGTPAAFTKAFRRFFGLAPASYRLTNRIPAGPEPPAWCEHERKLTMDHKIVEREPQRVAFVRKTGPYGEVASLAWGVLMKFAYGQQVIGESSEMFGISHDSPKITEADKLRYDACLTVSDTVEANGEVGIQTLPGGRYAVFVHKGAYEQFSQTYDLIFGRWLPESGETLRDAPCLERYLNRDPRRTKVENLRTEIFVPID
ncbi:AraC family transcriptional regulator [Sulfidibacter corallicola]|uniref:AraC family transcriptional regulator n=1 Tax=Sulfidibacter corallicola TaxID=2818388 RepID=A0A8A4THM4_SULCO|nr:AraC family transcriptional regulator [Sulfidibacter corallicola]QTD49050.1 AraC family transcriptional regulator [Sulfidibacter corallicola]